MASTMILSRPTPPYSNRTIKRSNPFCPASTTKSRRTFLFSRRSSFTRENTFSRDMTKALMTAQPGGTSTTMNTRQQATEADTLDERCKPSNGGSGKGMGGATSDHSPFSPRRTIPKSLDRNSRRAYPSSAASTPITAPPSAINPSERDLSLSKRQSASQQRPSATTPADNAHNNNNETSREAWKSVVCTTAPSSEAPQRLRRSTASKSAAAEPFTSNSKLSGGKSPGKEDSPASISYSDSGKPRTGTALSTLNRSQQLKSTERLTEHQSTQNGSSAVPNNDETPSPGISAGPGVVFTGNGGTEHGKPPKTPRSLRTTNSRSDAIAPTRPCTTTRAGDSEAISIPAATYAMKLGPQTVMSQWIISLDDNLDDEGSDNQHSAKWEDAQERLQRFVDTHHRSSFILAFSF